MSVHSLAIVEVDEKKEMGLTDQSNSNASSATEATQLAFPIRQEKKDPEFTLFPLLPTELRLKIWNLALTRREINQVYTSWNREAYQNWDPTHRNDILRCWVTGRNNRVRYACRESYKVGMSSSFEPLCIQSVHSANLSVTQALGQRAVLMGRTGKFVNFQYEDLIIGPAGISSLPSLISQLNIQRLEKVLFAANLTGAHSMRNACAYLRSQCPRLEQITLLCAWVPQWHRSPLTRKCNTRFIGFDSNLANLMDTWVQREPRGRNRMMLMEYIAKLLLKRISLKTIVKDFFKGLPEWDGVTIKVCIPVRQDDVSGAWMLQRCTTPSVQERENKQWAEEVVLHKGGNMASRYDGIMTLFKEK